MKSHLQKTLSPSNKTISRNWYVFDAKHQTLGRFATKVADLIRGKNKPTFSQHLDCGDYLIIINAKDVKLTGKKMTDKQYNRHSRYPGGLKTETPETLLQKNPSEIIRHAVAGMIPNNKLKKHILKKLKIYGAAEHDHSAQNPTSIQL